MRIIGIDPGTKRVGVALGHTETGVATPYEVWPRDRGESLARRLQACIDEWEAERVVVGLPRSLDGSEGSSATAARRLVAELEETITVPIDLHDERLSTVTAQASLHRGGLDTRRSRSVVDAVAAAVIVESWMETHRDDSP